MLVTIANGRLVPIALILIVIGSALAFEFGSHQSSKNERFYLDSCLSFIDNSLSDCSKRRDVFDVLVLALAIEEVVAGKCCWSFDRYNLDFVVGFLTLEMVLGEPLADHCFIICIVVVLQFPRKFGSHELNDKLFNLSK